MRIVVNILLFLLPFVLYVGWLHLKERSPFLKEHWDRKPVVWLGLFGLVLSGSYFLWHLSKQSNDPTAVYEPARMENGVWHPARLRPRTPADDVRPEPSRPAP